MAETIPKKSDIINQSIDCFKDSQNPVCIELVSHIEKLKIVLFDQSEFKCQSSLLGLQSELVRAYYLKKISNHRIPLLIPYVIKNC